MTVSEIFKTMDYGTAPESVSEADAWLDRHDRKFGLFIGGAFTKPGKDRFDSMNPANGEVLASLTEASAKDVDAAVKAASKTQKAWAALGGAGRARHLYALARLIQKHARLFAVLESLDNGKPIRESRDADIPLSARHFYHHAGWAQLMEREMADYEPIGVAGQVIPWNFPFLMLAWKIAPALAMGNTVVLKPAEYTSLTALLFADICIEAGLPEGVVNIITGHGPVGAMIAEHADVSKVAFTGSTRVGRILREQTAGTGKKLTLELGGKSPFIVFDDADIDSAIEGIVDAIWFNQGQVCCAGSRLLVQESIAETFHERLRQRMQTLRVGDPLDKSIDLGCIVDPVQHQRITQLVEQGVDEGATAFRGETSLPENGCYYPPTLLTGVEAGDTLAQEEIFGPVLVSMSFRTPAEAVQLANNSRYGLAASVWTENINLALGIAPQIKAGVIWINCTNQFDAAAGFGGYRESGFGREGGREGLFEYVKPSYLKALKDIAPVKVHALTEGGGEGIDRTAKMYIGGKQARPDSGYSQPIATPKGKLISHVGSGNRKDIRNAVEAATAASGSWAKASGHNKAQILYYIGENLAARAGEFENRVREMTGASSKAAASEVEAAINRFFTYAAWADKYDGQVHSVPLRGVTVAMKEPVGVMGIACPEEAPLLGFVSLVAPTIAMGNAVVAVPSEAHPLSATDLYQVFDTSDLPGGVVNIVTGPKDDLAKTLADHYGVDGVWYHGTQDGSAMVERAAAANLKRTWVNYGKAIDWTDPAQSEGEEYLRHATEVKNVWIPYGE
ncbi:aldehyde dehydrogenase family protein [Ruegeria sp. 2205SS24-7]|uniref:aldehyde dehydrogenase family protein n=1 Tax=Ruegeria discodermiae TaxID=3064389 RepID=UPI0027406769|nr:aldehyde dehydrogenase family protein [Ruegeria sp. 2205SS24-7]MDP5217076.1 aldehyde dehydrogenase family protein [Ruegeria sp. 2205SS24-7]